MALDRHDFHPAELVAQLEAERAGGPFLVFRDARGIQRILALPPEGLTVGREPGLELVLFWDPEVSRVHARLETVGGRWTVVDDGLSRNGTFVGGRRVTGRRLLASGDRLRFGRTEAIFREPTTVPSDTVPASDSGAVVVVTETQRRVLVAVCRPVLRGEPTPATNREVADELQLSVEGVRTHMKSLFARFDVPELAQNRKRAELVRRAIDSATVTRLDAFG